MPMAALGEGKVFIVQQSCACTYAFLPGSRGRRKVAAWGCLMIQYFGARSSLRAPGTVLLLIRDDRAEERERSKRRHWESKVMGLPR